MYHLISDTMKSLNKFRYSISESSGKVYSNSTFRSFVTQEDSTTQPNGGNDDDSFSELFTQNLLIGEMLIAEAQNVLLFTPVSDHKTGQSGVLFVTNFKLSFVTSEGSPSEINCQKNFFLGHNDVCLSNIDILYVVGGDKKKRLVPGHNISDKVKGLFVVCKNMKSFSFSFKFSPMGHGKTLTNALLHHAFPRRRELLFAYDFRQPYVKCNSDVITFREAEDWAKELTRTQACTRWRLSSNNSGFQISTSLPQWIVVSSSTTDFELTMAATHFRCGRFPTWCWSTASGAALIRTADINDPLRACTVEDIMLERVREAHPKLTAPLVYDLAKDFPSPKDLRTSFIKLRELCTPDSLHQFWVQDKEFLPLLESSKWLTYVNQCLVESVNAAKCLERDITIVLQESTGRDMCCLISSLVQLLLDPYYRTLSGFQSLIQKEWVMMGYPFSKRLGHVHNPQDEQSPLLLLFLDCVWQLVQLYPSHFAFTETYLTTLWDSAHISIFDTFLFDCDRDRMIAAMEPNNLILRSVWDWNEQLSERDQALFINPLYNPSNTSTLLSLRCIALSNLQLWAQCYFRFVPQLELMGGGAPQFDFISRSLLQGSLSPVEDICPEQVGSFYPFTQWRSHVGCSLPNPLLLSTLTLNTTVDDAVSYTTGVSDR